MKVLLHINPNNQKFDNPNTFNLDVDDIRNEIRDELENSFNHASHDQHRRVKKGNCNGEKWLWVCPDGNAIDFRPGRSAYNDSRVIIVEIFSKRIGVTHKDSPINYAIELLVQATQVKKERWWVVYYHTSPEAKGNQVRWYQLGSKLEPGEYRSVMDGYYGGIKKVNG